VGTAIKHHVPLTLRAECQSARMTKITDDGLIPCGLAHAHCAGQLTEIFWGLWAYVFAGVAYTFCGGL